MAVPSLLSLTIAKILTAMVHWSSCWILLKYRHSIELPEPMKVSMFEDLLFKSNYNFLDCKQKIESFCSKGCFQQMKNILIACFPPLESLPDLLIHNVWTHYVLQDFELSYLHYFFKNDSGFGTLYNLNLLKYEESRILHSNLKEAYNAYVFAAESSDLLYRFHRYFDDQNTDSESADAFNLISDTVDSDIEAEMLKLVYASPDYASWD